MYLACSGFAVHLQNQAPTSLLPSVPQVGSCDAHTWTKGCTSSPAPCTRSPQHCHPRALQPPTEKSQPCNKTTALEPMFSCVFTVFLSAILSDVFIGLQVREALQELPKYRKTWQRRLKHSLLAHEEQNFVTLWKNPQFVHSPTSPLGLSSTLSSHLLLGSQLGCREAMLSL